MKTWFFQILLLVLTASTALAQDLIVGIVTDVSQDPLIGATVLVDGSDQGTVTDLDGTFNILASQGDVLLISYIGYEDFRLVIGEESEYAITMLESSTTLNELVVVGYGLQRKADLTDAVETVKFKESVNQPVTNSAQLLYGRFSGVQLTQSSGNPGADGSSIVIRGIGTFGNSTPLIVIDNIQYDDLAAFNNLAPPDIASISVLKDASASAIYGARGANGVILVTTRRGEKDAFEISYNSYFGSQNATITPSFLNATDYATLINEKFRNEDGAQFIPRYTDAQLEAIRNGSQPDQFANTSWADEVLQSAAVQNHNLSLSGASERTSFRVSFGYLNQDAIVKSKFKTERYNLSLNIGSDLKDWLNLSTVTNAFWRRNEGPTGGQDAFSGDNGIIYSFQRAAPTIPAFYPNGEFGIVDGAYENDNFSFSTQNPLRRGFLGNYESDQINVSHRTGFTIQITDHLSFETSGSANVIYSNISDFSPRTELNDWEGNIVSANQINRLSNSTNLQYRLLNENILKYNTSVNTDHNLGFLLGHSVSYFESDNFSGQLSGFPTDNLEEFSGGGVVDPSVAGGAFEEAYQSFFGQVNYDYQGKYLLKFNMRRDGSSKFNSQNRYGNFPSASFGWRISNEPFMDNSKFISNLKVRASWGISGNDRIGNYIFAQTYNPGLDYFLGDATVVGVAITSLANPSIRWESTEQLDIGLDLGLLDNKIEIVADYFKKNSSDILYTNFPIPNTLGVTNLQAQNAASMINSGVELGVNHRNRVGGLKYSIGANITKLINNEVTGLGEGGEETITNTDIIRIGEPFRAYFGYRSIGVYQSDEEVANSPAQFGNANTGPGDLKFEDVSGPDGLPDGIIDANDRVVIGNPNPDLLINLNASLEYQGVDLSILFQGVSGVDRLLMGNGNLPIADNRSNALDYWINRWTPENLSTELPRVGGQNNTNVSSFYIEDASYLRMKNLELGYTFPASLLEAIDITRLRVFVGAQNLLTFTGLENFDPERANGNLSNRGAPLYKTITFGVNLKI